MDTTRDVDELLNELAGADPAAAADGAARLAELLAAELVEPGDEPEEVEGS